MPEFAGWHGKNVSLYIYIERSTEIEPLSTWIDSVGGGMDGDRRIPHHGRQEPFGGKVVVFGGEFGQTLPIVMREHGNAMSILNRSVLGSFLWHYVMSGKYSLRNA